MTLVTDNATCFVNEDFTEFAKSWNFTHVTLSPRFPKGNAHAEKAVGMVKQIYTRCKDPLFGILMLKTVPLLDVKESPDKIFFECTLNTNFPRPSSVHQSYEERYIIMMPVPICHPLEISRKMILCGSKLVNTFHGSKES